MIVALTVVVLVVIRVVRGGNQASVMVTAWMLVGLYDDQAV